MRKPKSCSITTLKDFPDSINITVDRYRTFDIIESLLRQLRNGETKITYSFVGRLTIHKED